MKPQFKLPALIGFVIVAAGAAFLITNNVTTVSAKQVLERASAAQSALKAGQGISHDRIEIYENPQAIAGNQTGKTTIVEDYEDGANGYYRRITQDENGKILEISAFDGSFYYYPQQADQPMVLSRVAPSADDAQKVRSSASAPTTHAIFDQFSSNPRVEMEGKETRSDGRVVYVLIDRNYETQKPVNGQDTKTFTGAEKMVFDAQTYQLLESETSLYKDGKSIVIESVKFLVDDVLPANSTVVWNLSDLKGISFVDEVKPVQNDGNVDFQELTLDELTAHTQSYVLKDPLYGFTRKIVAATNQPKDQPFTYEINYTNPQGETFGMQAIGATDLAFIKSNFYDGSYKTTSGMVLYFGTSGTAILATPDGNSFLTGSSLPREKLQELAEDLVATR